MNKFNIEPNDLYYSIKKCQETGTGGLYLDDKEYDGRTLTVNSRETIHLANCSYLALEKHPAIMEAAIQSLKKYSTQTSMSRCLVSSTMYKELEETLSRIYPGGTPIVYGSTTLAHYSALPILAKETDAILLDAYVHNSVRTASELCKARGTFVLVTKHNDIEHLRYLVKRLKKEGYKRIWYCADGIYSMHGDFCNVKDLQTLLDEEENFYAYVDDAHGIGWCGKYGSGYVVGNFGLHEKMIVAGSFSKSIATTGGFLVVPDKNAADMLKLTSNTFIFSSPITPSSLGAIVASLKLHFTEEIDRYQQELQDLILYFKTKCKEYKLSLVSDDLTPIHLFRIGNHEKILEAQQHLIKNGFFTTIASYPVVSQSDGGIRVSITRHLTKNDIDKFLAALLDIV